MFFFFRLYRIEPLFLEPVRRKSNSQMQGDNQYIIDALDINATIRAYQVYPSR